MNTKVITKNDIWRILGMLMVIGGQFATKQTFTIYSVSFDSNFVQICGVIAFVYPIALKTYLAIKERKAAKIGSDTMETTVVGEDKQN